MEYVNPQAEQIAYLLSHDGQNTAFVICDEHIYYAHFPSEIRGPSSAVVSLIQGIYDREPKWARRILRHRIYSTAALSAMCRGMVKVAAKSVSTVVPKNHEIVVPHALIEISGSSTPDSHQTCNLNLNGKDHHDFMRLALNLSERIPRAQTHRYLFDRPIAAVLTSKDGEILAFDFNSNSKNKTRHAEVNLIQNYYSKYRRLLPSGARLYTTLQPCRMCEGMIFHNAEDPGSLEIYFAARDKKSQCPGHLMVPKGFELS